MENAIKYSSIESESVKILIKARKTDGSVQLVVSDNGPGFPEGGRRLSTGVGISNVRSRLEAIYSDSHKFKTSNSSNGGAVVEISIPFQNELANKSKYEIGK